MDRPKRIVNLLFKSLLIFLTLAIVVMAIAPKLINLETVRKNIREMISNDIGGETQYRRLELSYLPRPHIVMRNVVIHIPDSFTINIHRMRIYPKILPLLAGSLQVGIVTLEYADYFMKLPQIKGTASHPGQISSFDDILNAIFKAIRGLPEFKLPELNLKVKYGKINLVDPFGNTFKLSEVQADYQRSPRRLDFSIGCKSNLWDQIDINGSLNPLNFKGKGHIELSRFHPQALIAYLFHDSALTVTDTKANLAIDIGLDGTGNLQAAFKGAVPYLALRRGTEHLRIHGGRIRGDLKISGDAVEIFLADMGLDYPMLDAAGMFSCDERLRDIRLSLEGSRVDASSVRRVALTLLGKSEAVQDIFKVIRSGKVPWMTVRMRGRKMADLGILENAVIKGRMSHAKIFIPKADLNLEDVSGDALISGGVLHGENLEARMERSRGKAGSMTLGLNKNLAPFDFKIGVGADLSQLPPILRRIVEDKNFLNELALVDNVRGTAVGILGLGGDRANLSAKVEASDIHLTARYKRIPHTIKIDGGHFDLEGTRLGCEKLNAIIGKSRFTEPSIAVDWSGIPEINVTSRSADLDLGEVYSWLLTFDSFHRHVEDISTLAGKLSVKDLKIKGPLFSPQHWRFQTHGIVDKLALTSEKLPKSLHINRGQFNWRGTEIALKDVAAVMGKSSIRNVAVDVNWGQRAVFAARSGAAVFHLDEMGPLVFSDKDISAAFKRFAPLKGTLAFASTTAAGPLSNPSSGRISFSGDINQFNLYARQLPGSLRVRNGKVSWRNRRLTVKGINASLGKSTVSRLSGGFSTANSPVFEGHTQSMTLFAGEIYPWLLSFKTIQPVLKDFSATSGIVSLTDLTFEGPIDRPDQWHYDLTCKMQHLVLTSDALGEPVTVNSGTFDLLPDTTPRAGRHSVKLKAADLSWGQSRLLLHGGMIFTEQDTLLDLTVSADTLDWNQINHIIDYAAKRGKDKDEHIRKRHLLGTINVATDNLNYGQYAVHPLKVEISLNPEIIAIAVRKATVCSISFLGMLQIHDGSLEISLAPSAENQALAPAVSCITDQQNLAMGIFDLNGEIRSKSKPAEFLNSLSGKVTFYAEKGRIYRFGLLSKLLAILNVTEIYRGQIPDLAGEGFAYRDMKISTELKDGTLSMQECSIDGVSMGIACEGDIDLAANKMDLTILVAPFKTVDRIVNVLPLVRQILGGKLISIPFRAKGELKDPTVIPLHPTAVGSELLGILERTLKLPITIIQPLFSLGKNKKKEQKPAEIRGPSGLP